LLLSRALMSAFRSKSDWISEIEPLRAAAMSASSSNVVGAFVGVVLVSMILLLSEFESQGASRHCSAGARAVSGTCGVSGLVNAGGAAEGVVRVLCCG